MSRPVFCPIHRLEARTSTIRFVSLLVLITSLLLIAGCASTNTQDESSPRFVVPPGSKAVVNRPLQTEPRSLRVFIQFGEVVASSQLRRRMARCSFLLNSRGDEPRLTIEPEQFEITRTQQLRRVIGNDENFTTRMELRSDAQPNVRELSCEILHTTTNVMRDHLSITDIREQLGEAVTLVLVEPSKG